LNRGRKSDEVEEVKEVEEVEENYKSNSETRLHVFTFLCALRGFDDGPTLAEAARMGHPEGQLRRQIMMRIVDSHAHLEGEAFADDREAMLARARAAGVELLLAIGSGTSPAERIDAAIPFAEAHDWIYATVGVHPHDASAATEEHFAALAELAKHPRVIAWGEMGLDYFYEHSPRDVQERVFRRQLELARAAKQPVVIHCRDAWDDCLRILEEDWAPSAGRGGLGGIFHCFTAGAEEARRGLEMGFRISFAGNFTYPKMQHLRDLARDLPLDRIFTETDSPYLAPQGKRGKRNEPANVVQVAQALADVRNLPVTEVAWRTAENFRAFFGLGAPDLPGGTEGAS
jgi:TatD DNase family protein